MNQSLPAAAVPENAAAQLRCCGCGASQAKPEPDFHCTACGELLEVVYPERALTDGVAPRVEELKRTWRERKMSDFALDRSGVWRYRELLPIVERGDEVITLGEGNTPLYKLPQSARRLGLKLLLAKHQGMNPTGSFKDTGMTAAITVARARGYEWVACASTGNTSASMAAYAARAGMQSLVLIPEGKIAWGKLSQALEYGATTLQLATDFDGCLRLVTQLARKLPIYILNSINPYRLEGQKTAAVELMEQLQWNPPDHIIVPGGNLGNCSALGKGLGEMRRLGLISRLPKLSVIQAEGANPLYTSVHQHGGNKLVPVKAETFATAIRIGNPASWRKAVRVLQETGGACEQVSEQDIALAKAEIGAEGLGCEPASAATLAGLKKLLRQGFVSPAESVVLLLTGHVLKDPEYSLKVHSCELFAANGTRADDLNAKRHPPVKIEPDAGAITRFLERTRRQS